MIPPEFLAAILAEPDDDLPRLVLADWLDERGDPRGEFIRVQCELAAMVGDGKRCPACHWPLSDGNQSGCVKGNCSFRPSEHCGEYRGWKDRITKWCELLRQERNLMSGRMWAWAGKPIRDSMPLGSIDSRCVAYHRGFVDELLAIEAADWIRHGDAIVASTPLKTVTLTTRPTIMDWASINQSGESYRPYGVEEVVSLRWPTVKFTMPPPIEPIQDARVRPGHVAMAAERMRRPYTAPPIREVPFLTRPV